MSIFRSIVVMFGVSIIVFSCSTVIFANGTLKVDIAFEKTAFSGGEDVNVTVTVSNPEKRAIRVLRWYTPIDGVEESLFTVTRDGKEVEYVGRHYKRPEPIDKDFIVLRGGESFTRTVKLNDYYDLSGGGTFIVRYEVRSLDVYDKGPRNGDRVAELISNVDSAWVDADASARPQPPPPPPGTLNSFNKCTVSQQASVLSARDQAAAYASNSLGYLDGSVNAGARYTTWFGVYSSSRYNTVLGNFGAIKSAMDSAQVRFDCGCKQNYFAYVYPTQPYNIYLCKVFWQVPTSGTDSQAGTLVHEMSHFNVVAGTDDVVYGQTGAKNLAISNPNQAVQNADSHEYFAENTPFNP